MPRRRPRSCATRCWTRAGARDRRGAWQLDDRHGEHRSTTLRSSRRRDPGGMLATSPAFGEQSANRLGGARARCRCPRRTARRRPWRCWAWAARPSAGTSCARSWPTDCACRSTTCVTTTCRRGSPSAPRRRQLAQRRDRGDDQRLRRHWRARRPVAVISTGGALLDVAAGPSCRWSVSRTRRRPAPRSATRWRCWRACSSGRGMLDVDDSEVEAAIAALADVVRNCGPERPTESMPPSSSPGRCSTGCRSSRPAASWRPWPAAGRRSSTRTASRSAALEELPEATHNSVVGYDNPDVLHDHTYVVFLASSSDHPRSSLRATLSSELLASFGISVPGRPHRRRGAAGAGLRGNPDWVTTCRLTWPSCMAPTRCRSRPLPSSNGACRRANPATTRTNFRRLVWPAGVTRRGR